MGIYTSRFILQTDPYSNHFVFTLSDIWETRPHEYERAKNFATTEDTLLDATCGLAPPTEVLFS